MNFDDSYGFDQLSLFLLDTCTHIPVSAYYEIVDCN